jgi:hypothetical protein
MALVAILPATAAPVAAAGPCLVQQTMDKIFIYKHHGDVAGSEMFDGVRGDATLRQLDVCVGAAAGHGLTAALPANIQNTSTGKIFQLGFVHRPLVGLDFVLVDGEVSDLVYFNPLSCPTVLGHRYQFKITNDEDSNVIFQVTDETADCTITKQSPDGHTYGTSMDMVWWGYERNDTSSGLGVENGDPNVNMAYMGYNMTGSGTWIYRTDLVNAIEPPGGGVGCINCIQTEIINDNQTWFATIGDWVYNNDKFNVVTDR